EAEDPRLVEGDGEGGVGPGQVARAGEGGRVDRRDRVGAVEDVPGDRVADVDAGHGAVGRGEAGWAPGLVALGGVAGDVDVVPGGRSGARPHEAGGGEDAHRNQHSQLRATHRHLASEPVDVDP